MIALKNVSVHYRDKLAVKNIRLHLSESTHCIIGPNGSGKTSLLKAIANLIDFDGEIAINGANVKMLDRKELSKMVSMLQQNAHGNYDFTVFDTVMLGRYAHQKNKLFSNNSMNDKNQVEKCLETLGLMEIKNKLITELSGGQLQRVFLARVLAQEPQVILLDEPTNHLDLKYQIELIEYLKKWADGDGRQVIGVFHDLNLAKAFSNNFVLMKDGEVVRVGSVGSEISREILESTYGIDVVEFMQKSYKNWENY